MPEPEYFEFTHDKSIEHVKYLVYRHYRVQRFNLYGFEYFNDYIDEDNLIKLGNTPVKDDKEFGIKMVIALSYPYPSFFFRQAAKNGQLEQFFPELFQCIGCEQNPLYHKDDVFDHTMLALDRAEFSTVNAIALDAKLAILFHDIGKVLTRKVTIIE